MIIKTKYEIDADHIFGYVMLMNAFMHIADSDAEDFLLKARKTIVTEMSINALLIAQNLDRKFNADGRTA